MKNLSILILIVILCGCCGSEFTCKFNETDITNMYSSYIDDWKKEANLAFDLAEKEVFDKPKPKPNDIIGPDPDPIKCICKGTGIIVQGDDHKTPCPFHSGQNSSINKRTIK